MVSETVICAMQVEELPELSETETVTLFRPVSKQLNVVGFAINETVEQFSVGRAAGGPGRVTVPKISRKTVAFWQDKTGGVVSLTETVAPQLEELAFASVTVRITEFAPRFPQLKLELDKANELILQLSEEPLLTCAVFMVPFPDPFKTTVTFWQIAFGKIVSRTVTTELQLDEFPLLSVTVRVTLFAPVFPQLKVDGLMVLVAIVQLSLVELSTWLAVIAAFPPAFNCTVRF